jgi:hypothetical protein
MTKKRGDPNDLVGFEEFIESMDHSPGFADRIVIKKDNIQPEFMTFIMNDQVRLKKLTNLVGQRFPIYKKFPQSHNLIQDQQQQLNTLKAELIETLKKEHSPLQKSLQEVFKCFFAKKT